MKTTIRNKLYDTTTAARLGVLFNYGSPQHGLADYTEETLHRKRTGEYFLHIRGGSESEYARPHPDGGKLPGEAIKPLTYDEAQTWAQVHLDPEAYSRYFGISEGLGDLHLKIDPELAKLAREAAARAGKSLTAYVEDALRFMLT